MKMFRTISRRSFGVVLLPIGFLTAWFCGAGGAMAQNPGQGENAARPEVAYATRSDTTIPLRNLPQIPPMPAVLGSIFERPRKLLPNREEAAAPAPGIADPVLQGPVAQVGAPSTGANFEGISNVNGVLPPDPSGAIGPNHYVQMVNLSYQIWDRNGNTLLGPSNSNTLWQGFGGPCQSRNDGDPVVLYDHLADRWIMTQFALPNFPRGPFYECVAVSQTPDPTGPWHRYEFTISQDKLNDYPKFGVWPDGYYMAINQFKCSVVRCSWGGQGVVVFERERMLSGQPARMVYFDLFSVNANLGGMLPADLEGPAPPPGTPNYFVQVDDNAWGYSPDQLQLWEFRVNWAEPASSTFSNAVNLPTASFDANLCGYSRNCIPQKGTNVKVDAISDRLMYRLQYRNFGSYQTLLANHTVDVNGADRAGIRWYELRNSGSGWSIRQQGTYAPPGDSDHRWMGSIAMNRAGDIALGYSRSSSAVYPSIFATGRLAEDALGVLTQPEIPIANGGGFQTHSSGRWGDYSQMSVDPVDDCTFWYTQEYYTVSGTAPWRTRIGSFQLRDCGGGGGNLSPTASFTYSCSGLTCNFDATCTSDSDGNIVGYAWEFGDGGTATGVAPGHSYAAGGTYSVKLTVTDNNGATGSSTQSITVSGPGGATTLHVQALTGSSSTQGAKKWKATATITIYDNTSTPVSGATVSGAWSGAASGSGSCLTGTTGQCSVNLTNISNGSGSVTFTVSNVSKSGLSYAPGDNVATSVVISQP